MMDDFIFVQALEYMVMIICMILLAQIPKAVSWSGFLGWDGAVLGMCMCYENDKLM